jgi:hypothetical protein
MDFDPNATNLLDLQKETLLQQIDANFATLNTTDLEANVFVTAQLCLEQHKLLKEFDKLNEGN